jgi:hypothetical protein
MMMLGYKSYRRCPRATFLAVAAIAALMLGSCGGPGSKDGVSAGGVASSSEPTTTSTVMKAPAATALCSKMLLLRSAEDKYADASDPAGAKAAMAEVVLALEAATSAAAVERPSFQAMQDALAPLTVTLAERNYELSVIFADKDLAPRLAPLVSDFEAATQRVDSIGLRECAIPLPDA